jgi:magnesium chelatase family protein
LASIVGGGQNPKPGEISLAHRGVLFLDELPEFRRDVLEALRQPLENGKVIISRAKNTLSFPAKFLLVAAMNPCPCGYFNDPEVNCRCTANEVFRYRKKISGPLLDRIDIQIEVPRIKTEELLKKTSDSKITEDIRKKVTKAREIQTKRFSKIKPKIYANSEMTSKQTDELINLTPESEAFIKKILEKNIISGRGYYRILKIAQTIADLEESEKIKPEYIAEAFSYRVRENEGIL